MSLWRTLRVNGVIYYPFLPAIVRNMIGFLHEISQLYDIDYIKINTINQSKHYLWKASNKLLMFDQFKDIMSCEDTKEENFGGVTKKKILNVTSETSTSDDVVLFCNTIDNIEEVLFVRLTKFEKNSSIMVESKKRRQVKGSDVLFLLMKKQLHMIQIKDRLTKREINNMYTGKKLYSQSTQI